MRTQSPPVRLARFGPAILLLFALAAPLRAEKQMEPTKLPDGRHVYRITGDEPVTLEVSGWRILLCGPVESTSTKAAQVRFLGEADHVRHPINPQKYLAFLAGSGGPVEMEFTIWGPATVVVQKTEPKDEKPPVQLRKVS